MVTATADHVRTAAIRAAAQGKCMILAIVGTRGFGSSKGLVYAQQIITYELKDSLWESFVTGDAPGIDRMTKNVSDRLNRECLVLVPTSRCWDPEGYKARNILIAEKCDELLCIRDPGSSTYGSGWTADYCETLGKPVTRVMIS